MSRSGLDVMDDHRLQTLAGELMCTSSKSQLSVFRPVHQAIGFLIDSAPACSVIPAFMELNWSLKCFRKLITHAMSDAVGPYTADMPVLHCHINCCA